MSKSETTEKLIVACVGAVGALVVAAMTVFASTFFVDANTERQTDVQMIELALGILQSDDFENQHTAQIMRNWAVTTINSAARVKFDDAVARALIDGGFPDDVFLSARRSSFDAWQIPDDVRDSIQEDWDAVQ